MSRVVNKFHDMDGMIESSVSVLSRVAGYTAFLVVVAAIVRLFFF